MSDISNPQQLAQASTVGSVNIPQILKTIKTLESGDYSHPPNAGGASGAYQFIQSTWSSLARQAGYASYANGPAYLAPPDVQDQVATFYVRQILSQNGGDPSAIPLIWYTGNPHPAMDAVPYPGAGNVLTPRQYQSRWMGVYNGGGGGGGGGGAAGGGSAGNVDNTSVSVAGATDHPFDANDPNLVNPTPGEMTWIKQNMGQFMWMMASPELSKILLWAGFYRVTDGAEIQSLVSQTNWFKTHSASQQSWIQKYAGDPATAARDIHSAQMMIQQQAAAKGITLTQDQLNTLAIDYNYYGLTQAELDAAVGQYSTTKTPSANLATLQQTANQYLVNVGPQQLQQWLTGINSGTMTEQNVDAQLKQLAIGKYPWMSQQIMAGMTPQAILSPYASEIGATLQVDPQNINFNDPRWAKLIQTSDPKTGALTQTPIWQAVQQVKQDPSYGWQHTLDARNQAYDTSKQLEQIMGVIA